MQNSAKAANGQRPTPEQMREQRKLERDAKRGGRDLDKYRDALEAFQYQNGPWPKSFNGTETACNGCSLQLTDGHLSINYLDGVSTEFAETHDEVEWEQSRFRLGVPLGESISLDGNLPDLKTMKLKLPIGLAANVEWHHFSVVSDKVTLYEVTTVYRKWTRSYVANINGREERWSKPMIKQISRNRVKIKTNEERFGKLGGPIIKR